jgi:hypothetical protein
MFQIWLIYEHDVANSPVSIGRCTAWMSALARVGGQPVLREPEYRPRQICSSNPSSCTAGDQCKQRHNHPRRPLCKACRCTCVLYSSVVVHSSEIHMIRNINTHATTTKCPLAQGLRAPALSDAMWRDKFPSQTMQCFGVQPCYHLAAQHSQL